MNSNFWAVNENREEDATRQSLLEAAEHVLSVKGYRATAMCDVAREADCSYITLSYYFETKEALFDALIDVRVCLLTELITERMQAIEDTVEKLREGSLVLLEFFVAHPAFFRFFFSRRSGMEDAGMGLHGAIAYDAFKKYHATVIQQAQTEGRVRNDIPAEDLLAFVHDIALSAVARWLRSGDPVSVSKQADLLWQFTAGGLGIVPVAGPGQCRPHAFV